MGPQCISPSWRIPGRRTPAARCRADQTSRDSKHDSDALGVGGIFGAAGIVEISGAKADEHLVSTGSLASDATIGNPNERIVR